MPAPVRDIILTLVDTTIRFDLEPARNAIHSLMLLAKEEGVTSSSKWDIETTLAMSDEERWQHRLVMIGMFYVVQPEQSWLSFEAYLDHLSNLTAMEIRDKLLDAYINLPCYEGSEAPDLVDKAQILASTDTFLLFLRQRFSEDHVDVELESQAYKYVVDPPAMKELIITHLQHMWNLYLADEWERVRPTLLDAVRAFRQIDFSEMSLLESAQFVTGQRLTEGRWEKLLEQTKKIVFVPSVHVGPYLGTFMHGKTAGVIFGARLPEGVHIDVPDLSCAEILVRLSALADDTRLRILKLTSPTKGRNGPKTLCCS
jgi:hypothetical protein